VQKAASKVKRALWMFLFGSCIHDKSHGCALSVPKDKLNLFCSKVLLENGVIHEHQSKLWD
jgi:hypothetical protein